MALDLVAVRRVVSAALAEDLGKAGDVTSRAVLDDATVARALIVARSDLVLAGLPVAREVFLERDRALTFVAQHEEGQRLAPGDRVAVIAGRVRPILEGERTALNFLMRLCGIATAARGAVEEIKSTGARILDTRKTAPGLRVLDKYAVAIGGACNHRMGLFDGVMIKDTHRQACGSIENAVRRVRRSGYAIERITVEAENLTQVQEALRAGAGRILLDNMNPETMAQAVRLVAGRAVLEASGRLRPGRLREVAETGVDCLSLGWLTHSAPASDLSLELENES